MATKPTLEFTRPHHLGTLHRELVAALGTRLPPEHLRVEGLGDLLRLVYDVPVPVEPQPPQPPQPPRAPETPPPPAALAGTPATAAAVAAALGQYQEALTRHRQEVEAYGQRYLAYQERLAAFGTREQAHAAALARYAQDTAAYAQQVATVWDPLVAELTAVVDAHTAAPPPPKANPLRDLTDAEIDADPRAALKALVRYWRRKEGMAIP